MANEHMEHPTHPVMYFGKWWAGVPMNQEEGRRIVSGKVVALAALGAAMAASLGMLAGLIVISSS